MSKPLHVLIVEDSEDDTLLMILALEKGGYDPVYERVEDAAAMKKALLEKSWDVILCDYKLPQFNGLAAIDLLKETGIDIPLIIVSGAIGEETAVECMRSGAYDYIMKDNLTRLVSAIEREMKEAELRSQLKQAEEELKESGKRYRTILQSIEDGYFEVDLAGNLTFFNDSLCRILGSTRAELIGMNNRQYTDKENSKILYQAFNKVFVTGKPSEGIDYEVIIKDGTKIYVQSSVSLIRNQSGQPTGFRGIMRNITKHKLAERELRDSKALTEAVVENVPLMIFLKESKDLRFVIFNRAGEELLGYDRKDLMGKNNLDLFPPEQAAHFMAKDREVLDGEADMLDIPEEPILTAKKGERILHTRKVCIKGSEGTTKYLLGISEDITDRKQAEEQLKNTLDNLRRSYRATIQVMVTAIETRDPYTSGHQIRATKIARAIATETGLSQDIVEAIRMAGPIHDIGKLSVPSEILSKPGRLSAIELSLVKEHARKGFEMLKDVESPWPLAEIVYQHHERMDGSGYPRGLKGDEIIMEARILAVADVVESMASHRPYRAALGINAALEEIEKNKGTFYDANVADACLKLFREKGFHIEGA